MFVFKIISRAMYKKYEYKIGGSVMKTLEECQKPLTRDAIKYISMIYFFPVLWIVM